MSTSKSRLRMGMVGGGQGAFIGPVHRLAVGLDGSIDLVAGCFSRDFEKTKETAKLIGVDPSRSYATYAEMASAESKRPVEDRIDFVTIVTPPNLHYAIARAFLDAGINVLCDKPVTYSLEEAVQLANLAKKAGLLVGVTHNYTGYPLVRHARHLVRSGVIGNVRRVLVEYLQDFLCVPAAPGTNPWRLDPLQVGICGTLGEAGVHCASLLEYVTGDAISEVCADRTTFLPDRVLEEDAGALLRLAGGGRGTMTVSQIATGEDNNLSIRVYGSNGALRWNQESPDRLDLFRYGEPRQTLSRGHAEYLSAAATNATRLPPGHPEGFLEAFANIYTGFAEAIRGRNSGLPVDVATCDFPTIDDGVRTMAFVQAAVRSCDSGSAWVTLRDAS
jgi:predicted dehydrogenase